MDHIPPGQIQEFMHDPVTTLLTLPAEVPEVWSPHVRMFKFTTVSSAAVTYSTARKGEIRT
jgi:hypothetical protein